MTNKVVLHYDMIKMMMRIERKNNKSGEDAAALVREGTAANGDKRETKEMEIAHAGNRRNGSTRGEQHPS